jgi:tyrosine-protein phosphatase YwqE
MFKLFSKNKTTAAPVLLAITTDIHSHILPGLDDGSPNIETSLDLVKGLVSLGYKKLVATPHIIGDMYRNTPEKITMALSLLQLACRENGIEAEISAAAEYMLDDYFLTLLRSGEPLLTVYNNFLLTEFSYASPTGNLHEIAFEIVTNGYQPILAHPERYFYYHHNYEEYEMLKEYGFLLQVNLLSLTGYYGAPVAKAAKYLFDKGMVNFVGTDMHHDRHLGSFRKNVGLINGYLDGRKWNEL